MLLPDKTIAVDTFDQLLHLAFYADTSAKTEAVVNATLGSLVLKHDLAKTNALMKDLADEPSLYAGRFLPNGGVVYHTTLHCKIVAVTAIHLAVEMGVGANNADLDLLCFAALLHDASHTFGVFYSGGKVPDSVNIDRAVDVAQDFCEKYGMSNEQTFRVLQLIRVTEWPSSRRSVTSHLSVLQDADLLSMLWPNRQDQLAGLAAEVGTPLTWPENLQFLQGISFNTSAGRRAFDFMKAIKDVPSQSAQSVFVAADNGSSAEVAAGAQTRPSSFSDIVSAAPSIETTVNAYTSVVTGRTPSCGDEGNSTKGGDCQSSGGDVGSAGGD